MSIDKLSIITSYGKDAQDTGSTSVQVALITARIKYITEHLKQNRKDHAARSGLMKLVGQRKRLLNYLKSNSLEAYRSLIERLEIRK